LGFGGLNVYFDGDSPVFVNGSLAIGHPRGSKFIAQVVPVELLNAREEIDLVLEFGQGVAPA
jgi:hypothetical protein